jgi:hydrogenase expression/formation protein HypD
MSSPALTADGKLADSMAAEIRRVSKEIGRPVRIMEVCGTHTVELRKQGVLALLPAEITLVSGPGCPVCVTPTGYVDNAIALAINDEALVASFGDMLRVPGAAGETLVSYTGSGRVKLVYSPLDLLPLARGTRKPVVFLGIGFETTIPAVISAFRRARDEGLENLYLYSAFKLIPPALRVLLADPGRRVDGFLLPGHVSVIIGADAYRFLEEPGGLPGVITGFEGLDMLLGILMVLRQISRGQHGVENAYPRAVTRAGNPKALRLMAEMLEERDAAWRGLGVIPGSGLGLKAELAAMDAEKRFEIPQAREHDDPRCLCRRVITGDALPEECPLFGVACTPDDPVGPCMVSSEGTCAAHINFDAAALRRAKRRKG